ncbi:MAG: MBL fold metallo-hydrolase [Myxococcales bacterium]|nr:MBL fold metallo-hydrolase [Myxococcales bacterium]
MFGNAPRPLWQRWIEPDDKNRIPLACRAALVREDSGKTLLLETGIGAFFEPKLRERYGVVEERHVLLENLSALGVEHTDVDVVVLSHLHFDHAGGLFAPWRPDASLELLFPKATFVVGAEAWQRAKSPHPRDRASFIPELVPLLEESGRLEVVEGATSRALGPDYRLHFSSGHTPGLMLTEIPAADGPIVFAADLVPGAAWVHLPITMGYDRFPELLIEEKTQLFADLLARRGRLFFTHDPKVALARLARDDRGRYHTAQPTEHVQALPC